MEYLLLLVGFVFLVKGADVFVTGAGSVAKKFNIPDLIIGLTIVALGTSAPEIAVSTVASINGQNEMAISNIIGSNFFNLLVVLGVCSMVVPLKVKGSILKREFPFDILASAMLLLMISDTILGNGDINILSRTDGAILLVAFAVFMYTVIKSAINGDPEEVAEIVEDEEEIKEVKTLTSVLMIIFGLVGVVVGGDLVVKEASIIAANFGMSETLIGLTIVALGTSLPELVTSFIACKKGNSDMAIGNVIGSNIFNILLTLGICSVISPVAVDTNSIYDALILLVFTLVAFVMAKTDNVITKFEGIVMIFMFVLYNYYIFTR